MDKEIKDYWKLIINQSGVFILVSLILMNTIMIMTEIAQPKFVQSIVDSGIIGKSINSLEKYTVILLGIIVLSKVSGFIYEYYCNKVKKNVVLNYKKQLLSLLQNVNGKYIEQLESGKLLKILDEDINRIESFGIDMFIEVVTNIIKALIVLFIMFKYNLVIVIPALFIQVIIFIINKIINKLIKNNINLTRNESGKEMVQNEQLISNLQAIILTNVFRYFLVKINKQQENVGDCIFRVDSLITFHKAILTFLNELQIVAVYFIGGILVYNDKMTLGEVLAFSQYITLLVAPCMFLVNANVSYQGLKVALVNIDEEIRNLTEHTIVPNSDLKIETIKKIEYRNIDFGYIEKRVLNKANLSIEGNGLYGIVGESGSGKTTLYSLLYRLWSPDKGEIYINDNQIDKFNLYDLRKRICIVCQNEFIFDDSIENNILIGNSVNKNEYLQKCDKLGITELLQIKNDMSVGENGIRLSGGQKERIAVARALLSEADVLILDEVTAALDRKTQGKVMDAIKEVAAEKIVIMIAHREEVLKNSNKIFRITNDHGIKEITYEELRNKRA